MQHNPAHPRPLAKAVAVAFATLAMATGLLGSTPALADDDPHASSPAEVSISKAVTNESGVTPTGSFTFHFEPVSSDGDGSVKPAVAPPDVTVAVDAGQTAAVSHQTLDSVFTDPQAFGHAGVFRYYVTETEPADDPVAGLTYDKSEYTMDVYVSNTYDADGNLVRGADGTPKLSWGRVNVYRQETPGTPGDADKKVDPTPGSSEDKFKNQDPQSSEFLFENKVASHENALSVSKLVTGAQANGNTAFTFTMALRLPAGYTGGSVTATRTAGTGAQSPVEFAFNGRTGAYEATVPDIKADDTIAFPGTLPAGTTVSVVEPKTALGAKDAQGNDMYWKASATFNGSPVANDATDGSFSGTGTVSYSNENNAFVVTNNDERTPATGLFLNNGPALTLIAVAAVAAVAYLASRKLASRES